MKLKRTRLTKQNKIFLLYIKIPSNKLNSEGFFMPKISSTNNKALIISFFLRGVITSVITLFLFNALFSLIFLKFDLSLDIIKYLSLFIIGSAAALTSYISLIGFKNNLIFLSVISVMPLLLYSLINLLIFKTDIKVFLVKIILIVIISIIVPVLKSLKKR